MPSKVYGPTDSVADTLTALAPTTGYQFPSYKGYIHTIRVGGGNVVNAKEGAGIIRVTTSEKVYDFAYRNGNGGATNAGTGPAEPIECAIPVKPNTLLFVDVLDVEIKKDVTVSLEWAKSNLCKVGNLLADPEKFRTMAAGGTSGSGDTAADTEESITTSTKLKGASLTPVQDGKIYQIRFAAGGVVDAKAHSAKLEIVLADDKGPYEFAVGKGSGGAATTLEQDADVINIPDGIPVKTSSAIDVKITSAEVMVTPHISLAYW